MSRPLPSPLRQRAVDAYLNGEGSYKEIAERFKVGEASVSRWLRRFRETGSLEPDAMGGSRRARLVDALGERLIIDMIEVNPDCTLVELSAEYEESTGVRVSPQRMSEVVRRLGYSRKRGSFVGGPPTGRTS